MGAYEEYALHTEHAGIPCRTPVDEGRLVYTKKHINLPMGLIGTFPVPMHALRALFATSTLYIWFQNQYCFGGMCQLIALEAFVTSQNGVFR